MRIRRVSTGSIMYLPKKREKKKRATGRRYTALPAGMSRRMASPIDISPPMDIHGGLITTLSPGSCLVSSPRVILHTGPYPILYTLFI